MTDSTDTPHQANFAPPEQTPTKTSFSLASMILGITSAIFGFLLVIPIVAIVLGAIGLKREKGGRGFAVTGVALGSAFLVIWSLVFGAVALGKAVNPLGCIPSAYLVVKITDRVGDPLPTSSAGENVVLDRLRARGFELVGITSRNGDLMLCVTPRDGQGIAELVTAEFTVGIRSVLATADPLPDPLLAIDPALGVDGATSLEFAELDCTAEPNQLFRALDSLKTVAACAPDGSAKYLLGPEEISGDHFTDAAVSTTESGDAVLLLRLDAAGTDALTDLTTKLQSDPNNRLAITTDGVVVIAPTVTSPITDGAIQVSGYVGPDELQSIVDRLDLAIRGVVFEVASLRQ